MQGKKIGFIGGGNMATSLIGGLIATGHDPDDILVADPDRAKCDQLAADHGVIAMTENEAVAAQADVIVLAVKPNIMADALHSIASPAQVRKALVISVAAGFPLNRMQDILGKDLPCVRVMPNTPALIRAGITGACIADAQNSEAKRLATAVLGAVGEVRWFEQEEELDAVTAVSGSGPAYFFYLMECMQNSAEQMGLDSKVARDLVLHTALGAAKLALHEDCSVQTLRERVTSPGGTTAAALQVLQEAQLSQSVQSALSAAQKRAAELSQA